MIWFWYSGGVDMVWWRYSGDVDMVWFWWLGRCKHGFVFILGKCWSCLVVALGRCKDSLILRFLGRCWFSLVFTLGRCNIHLRHPSSPESGQHLPSLTIRLPRMKMPREMSKTGSGYSRETKPKGLWQPQNYLHVTFLNCTWWEIHSPPTFLLTFQNLCNSNCETVGPEGGGKLEGSHVPWTFHAPSHSVAYCRDCNKSEKGSLKFKFTIFGGPALPQNFMSHRNVFSENLFRM